MASTATRSKYPTKVEPLAFELGDAHWKLGFTTGFGQKPRLRTIGAGDIAALEDEVALARKRFRLKASCRVVSCYAFQTTMDPEPVAAGGDRVVLAALSAS